MGKDFDINEAKKFLEKRKLHENELRERERLAVLKNVIDSIKKLPLENSVEVYLVGSITQPYKFHSGSDVDIVVKNFNGDRFDLWTLLEGIIKRDVEIIIFENCHFQDHIIKTGYKVL